MRWQTTIEQEARLAELQATGRARALDLGEEAELEELVERKHHRDRIDRRRLPGAISATTARLARLLDRAGELGIAVDRETARG